jgi:hypothetical protein
MPLAVEVRPMRQILTHLAIAAVAIIAGMVCFIIGATKQSRVDQAQFTASRAANACVEVPGEGKPNAKSNANMHRVE